MVKQRLLLEQNGQGEFEAKLFAEEGAKVVVTDINFDSVSKVAIEIETSGQAIAIKHDISKEEDWKNMCKILLGGYLGYFIR